MYSKIKNVQYLVQLLKEHGGHHMVLSPGARDIPISHSVEEDPFFTCYSVVDERSAAYFAIGLSQQLGNEIVAIVCTSSVAASNYMPGITEAFYLKVPLLVITCDRNPRLLGQMENQMIDQVDMFKNFCKKCVNLPLIEAPEDDWYCQRLVNEAILDDGSYRQSQFYRIIGPEFIEIAFRAAMEGDPDAELYLNDFSMSNKGKRDKYCEIIRDFKKKGIRIDAIGMQSHNGLDYPDLSEYEKSIDAFAAEGVKVMMTELDLNVLPNPKEFGGAEISQNFEYQEKYNPYKDGVIPADSLKKIDNRWMDFWKIYYKHRNQISRVTVWGIDDGQSWLNNFPVFGRTNYSLLFDRQKKEKPVVKKIEKLFRKD